MTIGFRCEPNKVHWVVLDGTVAAPQVVARGSMQMPTTPERHSKLRWLFHETVDIVGRYAPSRVAYKKAETSGSSTSPERIQAEGVVMAAVAEAGITDMRGLVKRSIASRVGHTGPARYVTRRPTEVGLQGIGSSDAEKEAALAAWAELP